MIEVPIYVGDHGSLPRKGTEGSTGWDLHAKRDETISRGCIYRVPTGLWIASPEGVAWQIRGRSGLASRGLWCHLGTIDQDYRGEVLVVLTLVEGETYRISQSERIAQLVLEGDPFRPIRWKRLQKQEFEKLTTTRTGGFGSTGR